MTCPVEGNEIAAVNDINEVHSQIFEQENS